MNINIKTIDSNINFKFKINFDVYGNLYLDGNEIKNDNYFDDLFKNDSLVFQLNISSKNIPFAEKGSYNIINNINKKINTFTVLDKVNSLKTKIKQKEENELNYDYNSDEDNSEDDKNIDYYPEDADHQMSFENLNVDFDELIDEENIKNYGYNNLKFIFSKSENYNNYDINYRVDGDIMALYDTYIYEDKLIFKSTSPDNSSIYRLRLFANGECYFRSIGNNEEKYFLIIQKNGELNFVS